MADDKKYLTFGKFNKKYISIIISYFFANCLQVFANILSKTYIKRKNPNNNFIENPFYNYFFTYLGRILMIIPKIIINIDSSENKINKQKNNTKNNSKSIEYIYNPTTSQLSSQDIIYLFCICFIIFFRDISSSIYLYYYKINFFSNYELLSNILIYLFSLIFIFLLAKIIYKIKNYRHQLISFSIIIGLEFLKIYIITDKNFITEKNSSILYVLSVIRLFNAFIDSFQLIYIEIYMKHKYFSPFKVIIIFGIIQFILLFIFYFILTFVPCKGYLCNIEYNGKFYLAHLSQILNFFSLLLFLKSIFNSIMELLSYIIINDFSIFHYFLLQTIEIIITQLFLDENNKAISSGFSLIEIFFILLFLEIIEINICKISDNTKKNIQEREKEDMLALNSIFEKEDDKDDEDDEDEGDNKK